MDGAHVDYAAAAAVLVHLPQGRAGGQEGTVEMDGKHLLPAAEVELVDRLDDLNAGIAHQHIDPTKCIGDLGEPGIDLPLVGDVHGNAHGLTPGGLELRRSGVRTLLVEVGDDHLGSLAGVNQGDLLADAAGGTRNQSDLTLQAHNLVSLVEAKKSCATLPRPSVGSAGPPG